MLNHTDLPWETDADGYLRHLQDWSPQVAQQLAMQDDITLTDAHWEIIHFLRDYYAQYQIAPAMRTLTRKVGEALGRDKASSHHLYRLFPDGPAKQASRYAGLPKPTRCL
jgi:tRNA 2-thiouridine synthesizing protein E